MEFWQLAGVGPILELTSKDLIRNFVAESKCYQVMLSVSDLFKHLRNKTRWFEITGDILLQSCSGAWAVELFLAF